MKVTETTAESILKVLAHPNGTEFYRPISTFGVIRWYTTREEALQDGLELWRFDLGSYKRNCAGRRTAGNMVGAFKKALETGNENAPAGRGAPHA